MKKILYFRFIKLLFIFLKKNDTINVALLGSYEQKIRGGT